MTQGSNQVQALAKKMATLIYELLTFCEIICM